MFYVQWITANLTELMNACWWLVVGTAIGAGAILSGLAAPLAERLEDAHRSRAFEATHRHRGGWLPNDSTRCQRA